MIFHNNIENISEILNKVNLLKTLPYQFLHILVPFLLWSKMKIFEFFKTIDLNKTVYVYIVVTNGLTLNHNKSLQIYFCVKCQAKNNFPKDVERTVKYGD